MLYRQIKTDCIEKIIKYNEDFIQRAKHAFPHDSRLHWLLDSGSSAVGRILDEATDDRITEEEVLSIIDGSSDVGMSLSVLIGRCSEIQERLSLYSEWVESYNQCIDSNIENSIETI